jgi:hypothetical protein
MSEQTIASIYADNDRIRERFNETVGRLSDEQASAPVEGEKWTIAQIVEHVSLVESGIVRICAKLLRKAESDGNRSEGKVRMSGTFVERSAEIATMKLEAPEIVHPSGEKTIAESLGKMEENRIALRELMPAFEAFDSTANKFPHPFFGDLSAAEWLVLLGGHRARHIRQIRRILEKK